MTDKRQLKHNMKYLIEKYASERDDLVELFMEDPYSAKYILSEIEKVMEGAYEEKDLDIIKEIAYYYI